MISELIHTKLDAKYTEFQEHSMKPNITFLFKIFLLKRNFSAQPQEITDPSNAKGAGNQSLSRAENLLGEMDVNNDGKLARTEAKCLLFQIFDEVDRNSDGFLTREEMEQMRPPNR